MPHKLFALFFVAFFCKMLNFARYTFGNNIKQHIMKSFLKYLGPIIVLIGVAILAIAQFSGVLNNTHLLIAILLFIISIVVEIIVNRKID